MSTPSILKKLLKRDGGISKAKKVSFGSTETNGSRKMYSHEGAGAMPRSTSKTGKKREKHASSKGLCNGINGHSVFSTKSKASKHKVNEEEPEYEVECILDHKKVNT